MIINLWEWLICTLFRHRYYVIKEFGHGSRKVGCRRCVNTWAMNDPTQSFLPWDADFEYLHGGDHGE